MPAAHACTFPEAQPAEVIFTMSAKPLVIRSVAWLGALFQLALAILFAFVIAWVFKVDEPAFAFFFGAVAQFIYSITMRAIFVPEHRRASRLLRTGKFAEAAPLFEASYQSLVRRPWLDRFRWLLLGGASAMSYREMALCNAAFCYSQVGDGVRATALYEQTVREFPQSRLGNAALNLIRAVTQPKPANESNPAPQ